MTTTTLVEEAAVEAVRIDSLILPDSYQRSRKSRVVGDIAQELLPGGIGCLHMPVVRAVGDKRFLLAGEKRIAAHVKVEEPTALCMVVTCSDEQAKRIRAIENAHRVHNPTLQVELLQDLESLVTKTARANGTTKQEARKAIAKKSGVSTAAIEQKERRQKRKAETAPKAGTTPEDEEERESPAKKEAPKRERAQTEVESRSFDSRGYRLDPAFIEHVHAIRKGLEGCASRLEQAAYELSCCPEDELIDAERRQIQDSVRLLRNRANSLLPVSVCPGCEAEMTEQPSCKVCFGSGWATDFMLESHEPDNA